jgi:hypothetical protein
MLLSPLPYPESDSIVRVLEKLPNGAPNNISTLNYLDWANQNGVFEYMAAEAGWRATLTGGNEPVSIRGALVSAHYFDIFGVVPAMGRTFSFGGRPAWQRSCAAESCPVGEPVRFRSRHAGTEHFAERPAAHGDWRPSERQSLRRNSL